MRNYSLIHWCHGASPRRNVHVHGRVPLRRFVQKLIQNTSIEAVDTELGKFPMVQYMDSWSIEFRCYNRVKLISVHQPTYIIVQEESLAAHGGASEEL